MSIQMKLDKTKPYGYTIGAPESGGGTFSQGSLQFDHKGDRITEISEEEEQEARAAMAAVEAAAAARKKPQIKAKATKPTPVPKEPADETETPAPTNEQMPVFAPAHGWTKLDMVAHAKKKFGVDLDATMPYSDIRAAVEDLY